MIYSHKHREREKERESSNVNVLVLLLQYSKLIKRAHNVYFIFVDVLHQHNTNIFWLTGVFVTLGFLLRRQFVLERGLSIFPHNLFHSI